MTGAVVGAISCRLLVCRYDVVRLSVLKDLLEYSDEDAAVLVLERVESLDDG